MRPRDGSLGIAWEILADGPKVPEVGLVAHSGAAEEKDFAYVRVNGYNQSPVL